MTVKPKIRIGLIGAGNWARGQHFPALQYIRRHHSDLHSIEIAAIYDFDPVALGIACKELNAKRRCDDLDQMLSLPELDCYGVIVAPKILETIVDQILPTKKPIFTEKPPGLDSATASRLAEKVNVANVVSFNRRYFPINRRFKELLGELDGPYLADYSFYRHERFDSLPSSGLAPFVTATACHGINLLEFFFGTICEVSTTTIPLPFKDARAWWSDLRFKNQICGRIKIQSACGSSIERLEVHGRNRSMYLHGGIYSPHDQPGRIEIHDNGQSLSVESSSKRTPWVVARGFVGAWLDFLECVLNPKHATISNFKNSVNTMRVAEMIENA